MRFTQDTPAEKSARVYFPGLNGLRLIAAAAVIIHHIEQHKYIFGLKNVYTTSFVGGVFGKLGIILFFVLSGFLITYLLLKEKEKAGTIHVKNFYIRRLLRIWPLYYLVVITGLFIIPHIPFMNVPGRTEFLHDHFGWKVFFMLFFLPNVVDTIYRATPIPYTDQTWSVGVEEQFYLIWPWLVKHSKNLMSTLLYVIAGYFIIKFSLEILAARYPQNTFLGHANYFWTFFCIDDIALGGVMACILYFNEKRILKFLFNRYVQVSSYLLLGIITLKGIALPHITFEIYAVFFAIIIINVAANPKSIISFENPVLNYLGKISYGLYLYHYIAIVIAIKLGMRYVDPNNLALSNIVYYGLGFALSIGMAALSYHFFELRFIRAKIKYSTVVSGDNVRDTVKTGSKTPAVPSE